MFLYVLCYYFLMWNNALFKFKIVCCLLFFFPKKVDIHVHNTVKDFDLKAVTFGSRLPLIMTKIVASGLEAICIGAGVLSFVSSSAVLVTFVLFPDMIRRKIFVHTVAMIALCDALASLAFSFGYPSGKLCVLQAALMNFFYRGSWLWVRILCRDFFSFTFLISSHSHPFSSFPASHFLLSYIP